MVSLATVGHETTSGALVCLRCGSEPDLLMAHRVGAIERRVVRPSANGQFVRTKDADGFDAPCELCGWPLR